MKLSSLLLAGSLVTNAALVVIVIAGVSREPSSAGILPPVGPLLPITTGAHAFRRGIDSQVSTNLRLDDPAGLFDRLRAAGFSPVVARALLAEQVRVQFQPRRAALISQLPERPFWEPATPDPKTAAALAQLTKEQNQAIKDRLGSAPVVEESARPNCAASFPISPKRKSPSSSASRRH